MTARETFLARFGAPDCAADVMDAMVTAEEQAAVIALSAPFSAGELADGLAERAYRRGVFDLLDDGRYAVGSFYGRLAIFAAGEPEAWRALSKETRKALDDWYFAAYLARLDANAEKPTEDETLTTDEMLARIDADGRQLYLAVCDCRALSGDCGQPTRTCLSYRDGLNSLARRGHAAAITKAEGKRVVLDAAAAGLIHTANPTGYCNCCGDCCYLLRARAARGGGAWLAGKSAANVDTTLCVGCEACVSQCPVGALSVTNGAAAADVAGCLGCGRCVDFCPVGAIALKRRCNP